MTLFLARSEASSKYYTPDFVMIWFLMPPFESFLSALVSSLITALTSGSSQVSWWGMEVLRKGMTCISDLFGRGILFSPRMTGLLDIF